MRVRLVWSRVSTRVRARVHAACTLASAEACSAAAALARFACSSCSLQWGALQCGSMRCAHRRSRHGVGAGARTCCSISGWPRIRACKSGSGGLHTLRKRSLAENPSLHYDGARTHVCAPWHACALTLTQSGSCMQTHTHAHALTHICACTRAHMHASTLANTQNAHPNHTNTSSLSFGAANAHARAHEHTQMVQPACSRAPTFCSATIWSSCASALSRLACTSAATCCSAAARAASAAWGVSAQAPQQKHACAHV